MARLQLLLLLLLLLLLPSPWTAAARTAAPRPGCSPCPAGLAGAEGASCGGRAGARCGPGLVCASRAAGTAPEGTGLCVCAQRGAVCGSDGRSYPSVCALRLRARLALRPRAGHLHKARDGPCQLAPVIVLPPGSIHNVSGAQVSLSCEVRAVPAPVITWRKVTHSPEGTLVLEDLPGDRVNVAVQVRGGPSDHEATAWIVINPLRKEDEGVYQCHSANVAGEAQAHGTVTVSALGGFGAPRFPAPEGHM